MSAVVAVTVGCTVASVACVYVARMLGCEGDGNAGVGSGVVVAVSACMGGTRGPGVLSSTGEVLEMSVVRDVGGVCTQVYVLGSGRCGWIGG